MKKIAILFLLFVAFTAFDAKGQTKIQGLLTESEITPLGIDQKKPNFTWQMSAGKRGVYQTAYRIEVINPQKQSVWDSGKVSSGESLNVPYEGSRLQPATRYEWKVTVWDQDGKQFSALSWFETGLMNPDPKLSAWDGAAWIGGGDEDLVLYAQYFSIFKLNYTQQIAEGSNRASFILGANDPRLMNRHQNIFQLENKRDESYIKFELDISALEKSSSARAKFNIYRAGYTDTDKPDVPLASFDVLPSIINEQNKYREHHFEIKARWGNFLISIDGNENFAEPKTDETTTADNQKKPISVVVNPFGGNGAVNTFGMLGEMGFSVPPNQRAVFSNVVVSNLRSPAHVLFREDLTRAVYDGIYAGGGESLSVAGGSYQINGGARGAFIVRDPSRNSMPMLRTGFRTEAKKNHSGAALCNGARNL